MIRCVICGAEFLDDLDSGISAGDQWADHFSTEHDDVVENFYLEVTRDAPRA